MELVVKKKIEAQEKLSEQHMQRVMDKISELEQTICADYGYSMAAGLIEHEMHYPKGYLTADADEAEMHFDEIADSAYDIAQKIIISALVQMNWLEAHQDFIKIQQRRWDLERPDA